MIRVDTVLDYAPRTEDLDVISLSRMEMQKRRIRRQSRKGYDVGIDLRPGDTLYNGAILQGDGYMVVIQQMPELVVVINLPANIAPSTLVLLGHILGNLHRPIDIQNSHILLPIQHKSEEVTFRHTLDALDIRDISIEERIIIPHSSANVSGHA